MHYERLFKYIGIAAMALLLFGLGGWYLFLRQESADIEQTATTRGFSIGIPSFLGSRGSTAANVESGLGGGTGSGGVSAFSKLLGLPGDRNTEFANDSEVGAQENTSGEAATAQPPRLWRVSSTPIAGMAFVGKDKVLRYVERSSGHVFDAHVESGEVKRVTNTLFAKIYDARVGPTDTILARTIADSGLARAFAGKISTTTQDGLAKLDTTDINAPFVDATLSRTTPDVLMLVPGESGTRLLRTLWNGTGPKQLATLPAGDFSILWPREDRIFLVERAASNVLGHALRVPSLTVLARGPGLMVLPHSSNDALIYSLDDGTVLTLYARSATSSTISLPVRTLAEKCAWAPDAILSAYCAVPTTQTGENFTDRWYRGEVHTEDSWYHIDVGANTAEKLAELTTEAIDVERPMVDDSGEYLTFMNARDKSLWVLRIDN